MKLKLTRNNFHLHLTTSNGAAFAIPIEVVRGIVDGSIDDRKYYQAAEFLSGEGIEEISVQQIQDLCEGSL